MQNNQARDEIFEASQTLKFACSALVNAGWIQPKVAIDYLKCEDCDADFCLYSSLQYGCDSYTVPLVVVDYVYKAMRSKGYSGSIVQFNDAPGRTFSQIRDVLTTAYNMAIADVKKLDEELRIGQQEPNRRRAKDRQRSN